jgi:soluble lytic murein transglycosylase-like protein
MFSSAPSQLLTLARKAAAAQSLDPALVCAVIEQESGWSPWATRYEPAFFSKYVAGLYTNNKISASEAYARGFSWGSMQVMGQVARETGFDGPFLSATKNPKPPPSRKSATTPSASSKAAALGDASPAPPNGSSSVPPPAPSSPDLANGPPPSRNLMAH